MTEASDVDPFIGMASPGVPKTPSNGTSSPDVDPFTGMKSPGLAPGTNLGAKSWADTIKMYGQAGVEGLASGLGQLGDIRDAVSSVLPESTEQRSLSSLIVGDAPKASPRNEIVKTALKIAGSALAPGVSEGIALAPTSEQILGATDKLGLTGNASLAPSNSDEARGTAFVRGAASAIPMLATGDAPAAALKAAPALLASSGLGGLATEYAHELMPDSYWGPIAAGVLTSFAGGGVHGWLSAAADARTAAADLAASKAALANSEASLAAQTLAKAEGKEPNLLAGFANTDNLDALVAKHEADVKQVEQTSAELRDQTKAAAADQIKQSEGSLSTAAAEHDAANTASVRDLEAAKTQTSSTIADSLAQRDKALASLKTAMEQSKTDADVKIAQAKVDTAPVPDEDIKARIGSIADKFSTEVDPDKIGNLGQTIARNILKPETGSLAKTEAEVWTPNVQWMKETPADLGPLDSALDQLRQRGGALSSALTEFAPSLAPKLQKILGGLKPDETGAGELADLGVAPKAPPTVNDVKELRSGVGEALDPRTPIRDTNETELRHIYDALTDVMTSAAEKTGNGDLLAKAINVSKNARDFIDGPISMLVKSDKKTAGELLPGEAVAKVLGQANKSGENLLALRANPETAPFVDGLASKVLRDASEDPKAWTKLPPGSKAALVPSSADRAAVETLLADKGRALGNTAPVELAAKQEHAANLAQLKAQQEAEYLVHERNALDARAELAQAKNAHQANLDEAKSALDAAKAQHKATVDNANELAAGADKAHEQTKADARASADEAIAAATRTKRDLGRSAQIESARDSANMARTRAEIASQKADLASREAAANPKTHSNPLLHAGQAFIGSEAAGSIVDSLGETAGQGLSAVGGGMLNPLHHAVAMTAGAIAPSILRATGRGIVKTVGNPAAAPHIAAGLSGVNAQRRGFRNPLMPE